MKEYPRRYEEHSSHASAVRLLSRSGCDGGVLLDLGCGRSPLAEVAAEAGFDYIGLDIDEHALADLDERGFEVHPVDLVASNLADRLQALVGDRKLAAVLLLDVLEHLDDPAEMLHQVGSLFTELGVAEAQLVVSIPNVTHFDLGAKLLAGRWDYLDTGLLDDTHLRFFDEWGYSRLFTSSGWREADRDDVQLEYSEQRFPSDAPLVRPGVPIREFLLGVRSLADPHALTYQFVRRFQLDPTASAPEPRSPDTDRRDVFASVVIDMRVGDDPATLVADLGRQTSGDFEVIVAVEPRPDRSDSDPVDDSALLSPLRGRCAGIAAVAGPTPRSRLDAAIAGARGRYTCLVAADTRVAPSWIERLAQAEVDKPGSVVVTGAVSLPGAPTEPGLTFFEEILDAGSPSLVQNWIELLSVDETGDFVPESFAVPTDALATTAIDLAADQPGATAVALLQAVELCGLARCSDVGVAIPRRRVLDGTHQLSLARDQMSERPFLLPSGSFSSLLELRGELRRERAERSAADATARAAEAEAHALAAQVERIDRELRDALQDMFDAEQRGVVGRLIRIAKRVLGR